MKFSLFYFDGDGLNANGDLYRLLLDSTRFADENGFHSVWTPERHFHAFGGLYPNPAVTSTALAMITKQIQIRSGSVVLPLHHPVRVAEDWAVIDNLSGGRVGLGVASGWTMDEFILSRDPHGARRNVMWRSLETVRSLWRGEQVEFEDASGRLVETGILPKPVQKELPVWVACTSIETFIEAGRRGYNALTSLLGETVDQVETKIARYRETLEANGFDPKSRTVTMMVHTFMGEDQEQVKEDVREPFCAYLKTHYGLLESLAKGMGMNVSLKDFSDDDLDSLLEFGVEGFMNGRSLIGTPESTLDFVASLSQAGVDEVGCLVDFLQDYDAVMGSLQHVNKLKNLAADL
ncbi:MAG: LLM class flavin-dependent oxidoreductase [Pseudomonadales bacterium]|nr:LLM class flavin-dependent oxidoreductase [Pseudomonadales bacterium]